MSTTPVPPDADDPVARLRALDPAADAAPDQTSLRALVDERRTAPTGEDEPAVVEAPAAPTDDLARARARRMPSWPARAAVAAAAALVVGGGGGYALGTAGAGSEASADEVITLGSAQEDSDSGQDTPQSGAGDGAGPETSSGEAYRGPAPSGPVEELGGGTSTSMPFGVGGRVVFTSAGMSDAGGTADAWALDPQEAFTEGTAAAAATALGIEGSPLLGDDGVWRVGDLDGAGPRVELVPDGTASLSYYDPTKDPWRCAEADLTAEGACTEADLGPAPQGDAAREALAQLLRDLGTDPDDFEIVAEEQHEEAWSYVTAFHVVDGQRTGLQWGASFTGAGLQSLHGFLAPVAPLGEYAVVSPTEAVERLGDPRFGAAPGPVARPGGPLRYDTGEPPPDPGQRRELPGTVPEGADVAWPVEVVPIVEARLGVAVHTQRDGAALLVPTYELTTADGGTWSVIAVTEDHLDLSPGR